MCGIFGVFNHATSERVDFEVLQAMGRSLTHRGPDDYGTYVDKDLGMGSCRLAILDLTPRGHMPMASADQRFWITYNGELYNYRSLRSELTRKGYVFRSDTDTEVLLNLYVDAGPNMLNRCNGMFAFAIWDTKERTLFLARDRLGVKPLVYSNVAGRLLFASEEKALFAAGLRPKVNDNSLSELLTWRYVAGDATPYREVRRLLPGHYMLLSQQGMSHRRWWTPTTDSRIHTSELDGDAATHFRTLFDDSISLRRISDVPLGVLLSGGLDSSSTAASLSSDSSERIRSYTIRFQDPAFDEGALAKQVAAHFGLKYEELDVAYGDIPALMEDATWFHDAPLVHASDLHLLAISRFAKPSVTVLLSGEGADETLGGYVRYRMLRYRSLLALLIALSHLPASSRLTRGRLDKAIRLSKGYSAGERVLLNSAEPNTDGLSGPAFRFPEYRLSILEEAQAYSKEPLRQLLYLDQHTYLQSLMDRNDRMTMGASIECREPFLDYRIVQWLSSLPTRSLYGPWRGKRLLRRAMTGILPHEVLSHKKWGFGAPWDAYLRSIPELRQWVLRLASQELFQSGSWDTRRIKSLSDGFLNGDDRSSALVRQLVNLTVWHEVCINGNRHPLTSL